MKRKARNLSPMLAAVLAVQSLPAWGASSAASTPVPLKPKTVTASKGPFKLTLEVANTEVREGDGLWLRLTLTNVSDRPRKVAGEGFSDVLALAQRASVRIEVRDAKTKQSMGRRLREDIMLTGKLEACLNRYEKEHPEPVGKTVWTLRPGESVSTPARPPVYYFAMNSCEGEPPPALMPPYGEIPDWEWEAPNFEVRAVYDNVLSPKREKSLTPEGRRNKDMFIRFETDWVALKRIP